MSNNSTSYVFWLGMVISTGLVILVKKANICEGYILTFYEFW